MSASPKNDRSPTLSSQVILSEIQTALARISERQDHQDRDLRTIAEQLKSFVASTEAVFKEIREEMRASSKTPWGVIFSGFSLTVSVMTVIGAMALRPIDTSLADLKQRQDQIAQKVVFREEHDARAALAEARAKIIALETRLKALGKNAGEN